MSRVIQIDAAKDGGFQKRHGTLLVIGRVSQGDLPYVNVQRGTELVASIDHQAMTALCQEWLRAIQPTGK